MIHPSRQLRFVDRSAPRAKPIPKAKWDQHKEKLGSLWHHMTLEELMDYMKSEYGFEPSLRQYIYQFEKWEFKKYNTMVRDTSQAGHGTSFTQGQISKSGPESSRGSQAVTLSLPPKRAKSVGSVQSRGSCISIEKPAVPPKKRQKLDMYLAARAPLAKFVSTHVPPATSEPLATTTRPLITVQRLATVSLQFASTGQPKSSLPSATLDNETPPRTIVADTLDDYNIVKTPSFSFSIRPRRISRGCFDSSRPIHTFSQQELIDMRMTAQFLRSVGFDADAFELFTILFKQLKESNSEPPWQRSSALFDVIRSASYSQQVDIARSELLKILDEPRNASSDAEHFLYRMLLAETYSRSEDINKEGWLSEIAIGCELASDRMLDQLPREHRAYDLLMYRYLNKCLEYLNALVQDTSDQGSVFTDKDHLQIRMLELIPGPFELRHGSMRNPCLRSCLDWCNSELRALSTFPTTFGELETKDRHCMYWSDHIALYCTFWERWQFQRRDCLNASFGLWMKDAETLMGITAAELLSIVCGLIMDAAPPRQNHEANFFVRARAGLESICKLNEKDLGQEFLDTYSLLGTLLGPAPHRQFHDDSTIFVALFTSTQEREAFSKRARIFVKHYIETSMDVMLPEDHGDEGRLHTGNGERHSLSRAESSRISMENIAATIFPTLGSSIHSSELSTMRSLRDHIQQAARRSLDADTPPSGVARPASPCTISTPVSDVSHVVSGRSPCPAQQRANGVIDAIAAARDDLLELFAERDGSPFGGEFDEEAEDF